MKALEGYVDIKENKKGAVLILHISGRLDAVSSPAVEKKVFESIHAGQHLLLINFAEVSYLSSAGMRMLLATAKRLKTLSGKMVVCCVPSNVMDVLKMSGFDHVLDLAPTEEEALARFK
jgi:anti-sigma B factor antagonist/stage II sporulation protein AA (anti-sigma F factor antagonist)